MSYAGYKGERLSLIDGQLVSMSTDEALKWDEAQHPRAPAGSSDGGEFVGELHATGVWRGPQDDFKRKPTLANTVRHWYEGGGGWQNMQQAARNLLLGPHHMGSPDLEEPAGNYDTARARVLLEAINAAPVYQWPLFRGLSSAEHFHDPKIGDTFSESLTSWTGKSDLAIRFAHNQFGSTHGHLGGDNVIVMLKASQTKGIHVSEYAPKRSIVGQADEWITSGEYKIVGIHPVRTEIEGVYVSGFGDEKVIVVERIGPAKAHDIRKGEWDEDKHPRQPKGAPGGGEFAYQGTYAGLLDTILDEGLKPGARHLGRSPAVYLAHDEKMAIDYAFDRAKAQIPYELLEPLDGVVFKVKKPVDAVPDAKHPKGQAYLVHHGVPADQIVAYRTFHIGKDEIANSNDPYKDFKASASPWHKVKKDDDDLYYVVALLPSTKERV